jgi:hypothetical protein
MPKINKTFKSKNVSISLKLDFGTEKIFDQSFVAKMGQMLETQSIKFMSKGISPVTGQKFARYKNPDKYPKNVRKTNPDKKNTPVNLKLSGDLYNSYGSKKEGKLSMKFGLLNPKGKVGTYAPVHNRDDRGRPDIPERKFLPTKAGELFNRTIMLEIKRLIVERIKSIIK